MDSPLCGADGCCASRRELKDAMNSKAPGESPKRFLRCSAHSSFERVVEYVMISPRLSSSSGRSWARRGVPHETRFAELMIRDRMVVLYNKQSGHNQLVNLFACGCQVLAWRWSRIPASAILRAAFWPQDNTILYDILWTSLIDMILTESH